MCDSERHRVVVAHVDLIHTDHQFVNIRLLGVSFGSLVPTVVHLPGVEAILAHVGETAATKRLRQEVDHGLEQIYEEDRDDERN